MRQVGGSSGTWGLGLWMGHLKSLPTWSRIYVYCFHKAKFTGVGRSRQGEGHASIFPLCYQTSHQNSPEPCFLGADLGLSDSLLAHSTQNNAWPQEVLRIF